MRKLSVIIPCLNEAEYIGGQLEALAHQQWSEPWEVIIADNGSTDQTPTIVEQYKAHVPNLRIVDASDRRGQAHAKNVGARAATGDALAFCDADDEVAPGWVAAIGEALSQYDFVASRFDMKKLNPPWLQESRDNPQEQGVPRYWYPPYLPFAGGCGLGVKRALHDTVGGFDESCLLLEDTDYCFRIQLTGTQLHFVPNAVVHIRLQQTARNAYRQAYNWGKYNILVYKKYRPLGMPKLSWKDGVLAWIGVIKTLPMIRSKGGRARWLWWFAWRAGRVHGCIQYRVLAL